MLLIDFVNSTLSFGKIVLNEKAVEISIKNIIKSRNKRL